MTPPWWPGFGPTSSSPASGRMTSKPSASGSSLSTTTATAPQPALLTGFTANHTLELTVRDLARIGSTIDAAVAGGATTVQGISYDTSDRGGHEAAALAAAVKDAHTKAQAMATAAGISLGNVLSIT